MPSSPTQPVVAPERVLSGSLAAAPVDVVVIILLQQAPC